MTYNELSGEIIAAAIEVHRELGPGLLESVYEFCLVHELCLRGFSVEQQVLLPIYYKGEKLHMDLRLDVQVEKRIIVEVKAVEALQGIHTAQLLTYLKLTGNKLGLLLNFNVPVLKSGIKRVVNGLQED